MRCLEIRLIDDGRFVADAIESGGGKLPGVFSKRNWLDMIHCLTDSEACGHDSRLYGWDAWLTDSRVSPRRKSCSDESDANRVLKICYNPNTLIYEITGAEGGQFHTTTCPTWEYVIWHLANPGAWTSVSEGPHHGRNWGTWIKG